MDNVRMLGTSMDFVRILRTLKEFVIITEEYEGLSHNAQSVLDYIKSVLSLLISIAESIVVQQ